jgi:hypothetical protein
MITKDRHWTSFIHFLTTAVLVRGRWNSTLAQIKTHGDFVRFQVLTTANMKITVFWDAVPCSLVKIYRRFRGACCLHHQAPIALMMEAASTSETSFNVSTKRRSIPEDSHLRYGDLFEQLIINQSINPVVMKAEGFSTVFTKARHCLLYSKPTQSSSHFLLRSKYKLSKINKLLYIL